MLAKDDRDRDKDKKTRATIFVGGTETQPVVERCPDRLVAFSDDELVWDIDFASKKLEECVEVQLRNFRCTQPGPEPSGTENQPRGMAQGNYDTLFQGGDDDRKNKHDRKQVKDKVQGQAKAGIWNYDIHLNGKLAVDPEIVIKDSP